MLKEKKKKPEKSKSLLRPKDKLLPHKLERQRGRNRESWLTGAEIQEKSARASDGIGKPKQ